MKNDYRNQIQTIANNRGVEFLLHFTQIANLPGIVKHGILPRRELHKSEHLAYASDQYRLDENLDAVSVSISRINEEMFRSKRRKSGHDDWLILVISAEILWSHRCIFCWRNAARNEIRNHRGWRGGPWAFSKMFDGRDGAANSLPMNYPADPEAEVQVLDPIAPNHILGAVVNKSRMVEPVREMLRDLLGDSPSVAVEDF